MSHVLSDEVAVRPESRAAPLDTVAIVNETSERIVRTLVIGLPPAALVCAGWLARGGTHAPTCRARRLATGKC